VSRRPGAIALVRAANAVFCFIVSVYCLLAYSPFAYAQFIKPDTVPAITNFVAVSPWLFVAIQLATILTIMPQLRGAPGHRRARPYLAAGLAAAAVVFLRPPLDHVGHTPAAFAVGLLALVSPIWLAAIDHAAWPAVNIRTADAGRALTTCVVAAAVVWAAYAGAAPMRLRQMIGVELAPSALASAATVSLILHLFVFAAVFLVIVGAIRLSLSFGRGSVATYWLLVACLAVCSAAVVRLLICGAIAFTGRAAWVWSGALGVTVAAAWADLARLRSQRWSDVLQTSAPPPGRATAPGTHRAIDSIDLFCAPMAATRVVSGVFLVAMPIAAYALVEMVRHLDWNFLLQKLSVLVIWMATFACAGAAIRERRRRASGIWLAAIPVLVFGLSHASRLLNIRSELDRYAALDPSFRLIRDAQSGHSSATAEYYRLLRANTLLAPRDIHPPDVDFVRPLGRAPVPPPNIFLIVVDSMRRDYLSPYNAEASFTPAIARLAADSFVFRRAFTRYSGTSLAVPSIWGGGMVPHALEQPAFPGRNALQKLLDANGYRRIMDMDSVVEDLMPRDARLEELDRGKRTTELDLCATLDELEQTLLQVRDQPVFFYSLPQNVHIAIATRRAVPQGERYPAPFYDRVASSLHRIDGCLGGFLTFLRREDLFDNSIVIVTSDHGDSLGEEGRWGHAYFMYPEVMNIPLIVRLPPWLNARVRTDLDAAVFSTDITPTLYALLGYVPQDLGPLFGRPIFAARNDDTPLRRGGPFLLASSYGAVYGVVRQNGRRMHVVDAVDGQEYAFDLSGPPEAAAVTPAMSSANRRVIAEQIAALASRYRYHR